ncbi:MAG: hypothetical protein CME71_03385 [Halobacteriovorax sp.]|nr:hypothetical protein [Halobacteriovorax sp.]
MNNHFLHNTRLINSYNNKNQKRSDKLFMKIILLSLLIPFSLAANIIDIEELQSVTRQIDQATASPTEHCETCAGELDQETINKSVVLTKSDIEIVSNYTGGDDFVIALKRTSSTPRKVKIKIEYGEKICARTVMHQNPLSGELGFSCLIYTTEKRSKTIPIDFENASVLNGDESQSYRLVLSKTREAAKLNYKLAITNGMFDTIEEKHGFLGMGSTRYEINRRQGSRAPAVIPD